MRIESENDIKGVLKYFNKFHDGFIKRISLVSHDSYERNGPRILNISHVCTGSISCIIDIAHYNYGAGSQPMNRIVQCEFKETNDFCLDLKDFDLSYGWSVKDTFISPLKKDNANQSWAKRFSLSFLFPKLLNNSWTDFEVQILSFTEASFNEIESK